VTSTRIRRRITLAIVALSGALLLPSMAATAAAEGGTDTRTGASARIDRWIEQRMEAHAMPGVAVAVVRGGQVVHLAGYGHAHRDGSPVTPDTAFLVGSVSKPITAALVHHLVADGVLAWDEPVWPHLSHLAQRPPAGFETATVEQLLTHTAGFRMSVGVAGAVEVHDSPDALRRRVGDLLSHPLTAAPGERWEYSNAGPTLLAAVVEQVTGRTFAEDLEDRVFAPLGMTGAFATSDAAAAAPLATGHELWFGRWRPAAHAYDEAGVAMGYVGATARDLAAFMQAHLDGHPALPVTAGQLAAGPVHATGWDVPLERGYGRGWFVDELAGHQVISHSGSLGHFVAHVILVPGADGLGVAVLSNASAFVAAGHAGQYDLSVGLATLLLDEPPVPADRPVLLSLIVPATAWALLALLVVGILRSGIDLARRRRPNPHRSRTTLRTWAPGIVALLAAGATLILPMGTARHFYPDAAWGATLAAAGAAVWGLLRLARAAVRPHGG
jgi:CubicO group peptidase (beta-lactamase class C family)